MSDSKITLWMSGPEGHTEFLRLNDFIGLLQTITNGLDHLNNIINTNRENRLRFRISNLSHSSPFAVEMQVHDPAQKGDMAHVVVETFIEGINSIENKDEIPSYFDIQLIDYIKQLSNYKKKSFSEITITNTKSTAHISNQLEGRIDIILGEDTVSYGNIKGKLERVNFHNEANKFYIYPTIGANRVECKFKDDMFEKIRDGLKRFVNIKGKMFYRAKCKFPYRILVDDIEVYPTEDQLPTLSQMRGMEPNLTGDMDTDDFIRFIREENE